MRSHRERQSVCSAPSTDLGATGMALSVSAIAPWVCLVIFLIAIQGVFIGESAELSPPREARRVNEKDMLTELQDVLEKLQSKRILSWESKLNQVPKVRVSTVHPGRCLRSKERGADRKALRLPQEEQLQLLLPEMLVTRGGL
ncbi:uncharacterized protein LOC116406645 isoform X1 [Xenopus tropicalis]|uniref:Uncharacterized protein LOC116406645 isoform X1 n=1 Tax=Xenopus tropicalis TaxID=8364 RepID=A0A8J1IQD1_XENTR|nr:uncharacterized protein LOC116406645 isoform X1 [Xenopus tropicalis]